MRQVRSLAFAVGLVGSAVVTAQEAATPPPTRAIVVLYADDAGWSDFGFQPHPAPALAERTPRIDSIAADGVRFTNAYMSGAVCSPSRAGLLTGRYQQRFGHETNIPPGYMGGGMSLDERTIADRMRALDFATGIVGKWHLGYPKPYQPNQRGFDWFHGLLQGSRSYRPYAKPTPHRVIQENGEALPEVGYVTDRFGDAAARWIGERADEPFFLFVSFTAPHGPLQPLPADVEKLAGIENERRRNYAGLIVGLDRAVGRVLDALDEHGLRDRSLVVFTNDNGGQTRTGARNKPLRGRKGQLYEGGIRVPLAMRWPGRIAPATTIDDPVISLDFLPTFVRAAGGEVDAAWQLDGVDLVPRLTGAVDVLPERDLFWRHGGKNGSYAMRRGSHKLLVLPPSGRESAAAAGDDASPARPVASLFDLDADLGEADDLATDRTDVVRSMREALDAWAADLAEPAWASRARRRRR